MTARKKARRPEHVGGPRRPKAAAPSFARVRRVKQGATTWEASGRPAVSSANSSFRVRRHRSPMLYGPDGELKCGEDDWDQLRSLFRQNRLKEEQCDHCDSSALRHIEETTTLNVWCLQKTIASQFRDGRSLQQLIDLLEAGSDLPMREPSSILGVFLCACAVQRAAGCVSIILLTIGDCGACIWPAAPNCALRWNSRGR